MEKHYISGLVGSSIPGFFWLVLVFWSLGGLLWNYAIPAWLAGGLAAGFIGSQLEKIFAGSLSPIASSGLVALSAILGFLFSALIGFLIIT